MPVIHHGEVAGVILVDAVERGRKFSTLPEQLPVGADCNVTRVAPRVNDNRIRHDSFHEPDVQEIAGILVDKEIRVLP